MTDSCMKSYVYSEDDVVESWKHVFSVAISPNTVLADTLSFKYNIYFLYFQTSSLGLIPFNLNWPFLFFNS